MAAAFIIYLPGLPEEKRRASLETWKSILGVEEFSLQSFMATEQKVLLWQAENLPSDAVSIENAIVTLNVSHFFHIQATKMSVIIYRLTSGR
jgi:hypothetical protein